MKRYTAPGLPPHPALLFDPATGRAKVTARHATWQSEEWASRATVLFGWLVVGLLLWRLWRWMTPIEVFPLMFLALLAAVFGVSIVHGLMSATLRPFLARQVFAKRTTMWVTPDAVAFQSHLYDRPVIIWRRWDNHPIGICFIVSQNEAAERYASHLKYKERAARPHLDKAALLKMVLTSARGPLESETGGQDGSQRAVPIADIHRDAAARFSMVYAAALTLTSQPSPPDAARRGVDIESE